MRSELLSSLTINQRSELVNEMRGWIKDCQWGDLEEDEVDSLTDEELIRGICRNYSGGINQFILDNDIIEEQAPPHGSLYGEPCGDRR